MRASKYILFVLLTVCSTAVLAQTKVFGIRDVYSELYVMENKFGVNSLNLLENFKFLTLFKDSTMTWVVFSNQKPKTKNKKEIKDFGSPVIYFVFNGRYPKICKLILQV